MQKIIVDTFRRTILAYICISLAFEFAVMESIQTDAC